MDRPSWGSIMRRHRGATDLRRAIHEDHAKHYGDRQKRPKKKRRKARPLRERNSKKTNEEKTLSRRQL
jgi:hypothetical protein